MPLYHYQCPVCKAELEKFCKVENRNKEYCPKCQAFMERPIRLNLPTPQVWKPLTLTNFSDKPMTFETKKSLQDHCKKTGLSSGALL